VRTASPERSLLLAIYMLLTYPPVGRLKEVAMSTPTKTEVLQGTLDLLVLKTLDTLGPLHGFGIARRIQLLPSRVTQNAR
jgi:hypothetical protein